MSTRTASHSVSMPAIAAALVVLMFSPAERCPAQTPSQTAEVRSTPLDPVRSVARLTTKQSSPLDPFTGIVHTPLRDRSSSPLEPIGRISNATDRSVAESAVSMNRPNRPNDTGIPATRNVAELIRQVNAEQSPSPDHELRGPTDNDSRVDTEDVTPVPVSHVRQRYVPVNSPDIR